MLTPNPRYQSLDYANAFLRLTACYLDRRYAQVDLQKKNGWGPKAHPFVVRFCKVIWHGLMYSDSLDNEDDDTPRRHSRSEFCKLVIRCADRLVFFRVQGLRPESVFFL